ncbi:MAG: hypothetical protein PHG31_02685 [Candidatus Omnitrophica bacterium]|nr:hypothetical protein [Candidatus Omnitrophota bacterium]
MPYSSFSPKARWDRHIHETGEEKSSTAIGRRIEVLVWFKNTRANPRLFIWNNNKYKIKEITYYWQERRGQETLHCFSVSTGLDLYQISFSSVSLSWRLDKVIS